MNRGPRALINRVGAVRIFHESELFAVLHQLVDQHLRSLEMYVVIPGSMHQQQMPLQPGREVDGASAFVAFRIVLRQTHVALLVDRVVEPLIRDRRHSHSHLVCLR